MKAWEYLIFEHLYIIKGKRINPLNKSFDPVKSEGWDDFISKPYIGQGCRFFRRDIRLWVSDSKVEVAKIFKNVSKAAVPPEVLLVLKQLLSFEQNYDKLEEIGLFERPPSDADLELEAERRLNLMKSFYNPEEEVWTDHEIVQLKRTGIAKKEVGTLKRKSELMLEDKRINKFQKSSSVSSNVSSSDTEDDDEEASEDDFIMEEDQISAEIRKLAGKENPQFALKESKKYLVENISQNCDEKNDRNKSGKSIAKNLKISNEADFTFKKLLQILPLPTLNNELEEKYTFYLQKKESPLLESKEDRQEVIFDEKDNCSLKLKTGDNLFIKREIIKKN
ncbi:hypothetical protein HK099_001773 [Clydaea vesicula]|uniref:Uncharacterized protein n=1 Tax=Clydaea vesicula TaxID=447962 RepID=A0AAD5XVU5_9FUNG|nr:hypothetical protein HK099_001773 [Clydaea vesicula]